MRRTLQSRDEIAVFTQCQAARKYGTVIGHGCARTIASWYASPADPAVCAFVGTGAVGDPAALFAALTEHGAMYESGTARHRRALEHLAVYLLLREDTAPVPGWSDLWAR